MSKERCSMDVSGRRNKISSPVVVVRVQVSIGSRANIDPSMFLERGIEIRFEIESSFRSILSLSRIFDNKFVDEYFSLFLAFFFFKEKYYVELLLRIGFLVKRKFIQPSLGDEEGVYLCCFRCRVSSKKHHEHYGYKRARFYVRGVIAVLASKS